MSIKDKLHGILYPSIPVIPTTQAPEDTRYTFAELWVYLRHFRFLKDWAFWLIVAVFTLAVFFG